MFITLFKYLLLPPGLQLLLAIIALVVWRRWRFLSRGLLIVSLVSLWLLSLPSISYRLFVWLEAPYIEQPAIERQQQAQAIVVLGGGRDSNAPEFGGADQVSAQALQRLRYGAYLSRRLSIPVVVTGGTVYPYEQLAEAELAEPLLRDELGIGEVWLETQSRNTWQNAEFTAQLLRDKGVQQVILVTHGYHMRRAQLSFQYFGVDAIPMATGFFSTDISNWWDEWLPKARALDASSVALHEYLGLLHYRWRQ